MEERKNPGDAETDVPELHCLSVQSSVVFGYVGNKAATFPLQLLGFDVSPLNSVQFSNHTGYGKWRGDVLEGPQFDALVEGLAENGLLSKFSHVLTGYMRSASFAASFAKVMTKLHSGERHPMYLCDPVLGDNGKLYVPEDLVCLYRDTIVPLADVVTPNQFECELLSGVKFSTVEDGFRACDTLHRRGPHSVVVTSSSLGTSGDTSTLLLSTTVDHVLENPAVRDTKQALGSHVRAVIEIPRLDRHFTGTGDLIAALLLAWMQRLPADYITAVENALASVQAVVKTTAKHGGELRVVACKTDIETPPDSCRLRARLVHC